MSFWRRPSSVRKRTNWVATAVVCSWVAMNTVMLNLIKRRNIWEP